MASENINRKPEGRYIDVVRNLNGVIQRDKVHEREWNSPLRAWQKAGWGVDATADAPKEAKSKKAEKAKPKDENEESESSEVEQ